MVFRMELTNSEIDRILDMKYIATSSTGCTFPPEIYEIIDINSMLKSLFPDEVKVDNTIDVIRIKSNLRKNKTTKLTKNHFFYYIRFYTVPFGSSR